MIDLKLFDIKKAEKDLKKVCKDYKTPVTGIDVLLNNMKIYNHCVEDYLNGGKSNIQVMFQISGSIFKQLKEYKLTPPKKALEEPEEDDIITTYKKKIEKR